MAERAEQPFVFEADIEAAEAFSADVRTRSVGLGGLFCLGLLVGGMVTCHSLRTVLAGVAVAAAGAVVALGIGRLSAGWTISLIRARSGVPAAFATRGGFWRKTSGEVMGAKLRFYFGRPRLEDVPPGMTLDEYARARGRAKRIELWSVLLLPVMFIWFLLALAAIARPDTPTQSGEILLTMGVFCSTLVAGPGGWLARWRRERDAVARWAGALTMDEFMQTRGWEWHWVGGWRRTGDDGEMGASGPKGE